MSAYNSQCPSSCDPDLETGTEEFKQFWQNGIGYDAKSIDSAGDVTNQARWIKERSRIEVRSLIHLLNLPKIGTFKVQRDRLGKSSIGLWPYRLVDRFAVRRSRRVVEDVANEFLDEATIEVCREKKGTICVRAALYLLYSQNAEYLLTVQHLQAMEKRGFAHLHLTNPPRRPEQKYHDFMTQTKLETILATADAILRDDRRSELREILKWQDRSILFIRRPAHHRVIMADGLLVHGFDPDLLMIEFADNGKLLRIAGHNTRPARIIADQLASAYRKTPCQYEEDLDQAYTAQIRRLVDDLASGDVNEFALTELSLKQSALDGASGFTICNENPSCLLSSMNHFSRLGVTVCDDLDRIESMTVVFQSKRVKLTLEPGVDDCITIRFSDHRLGLLQRGTFENLFRSKYGISILPTERAVAVERLRRRSVAR